MLMIGIGISGCVIIGFCYILKRYQNNTLKSYLRASWGKVIERDYDYNEMQKISNYWGLKRKQLTHEKDRAYIDDITWDDLDMDEVFAKVNFTQSYVGESYLYSHLHTLSFDKQELEQFEKFVQHMDRHEVYREEMQTALHRLAKGTYHTIEKYLFELDKKKSVYENYYSVLGLLPILGIMTLLFDLQLGSLFIILTCLINGSIHVKHAKSLGYEMHTVKAMYAMVCAAKQMSQMKEGPFEELLEELNGYCDKLGYMTQFGMKFMLHSQSDIGVIQDYIGILTLTHMRIYHNLLSALKENPEALKRIYEILGMIDTSISVAHYRQTLEQWTRPIWADEGIVDVKEIEHPLIDDPVSNTVCLSENILVTGSNASGKSSFVKAIAINGILAQSIHTVLAKRYIAPLSYYMTSMAVTDSIVEGESYYIAEIKSLKRVLDAVEKYPFCMCFVDEILKGTNTVERIAASTAILKALAKKRCMCMVATHDIELTRILEGVYSNYHFRENVDEDGISFDYQIHKGPAVTRNAIKLLKVMEYDSEITDQAEYLATHFLEKQVWVHA